MGKTGNIAEQINLQEVDYLMAFNDNQPILRNLGEIFLDATQCRYNTDRGKGPGKTGKRTWFHLMDTTLLEQRGMYERWPVEHT